MRGRSSEDDLEYNTNNFHRHVHFHYHWSPGKNCQNYCNRYVSIQVIIFNKITKSTFQLFKGRFYYCTDLSKQTYEECQ